MRKYPVLPPRLSVERVLGVNWIIVGSGIISIIILNVLDYHLTMLLVGVINFIICELFCTPFSDMKLHNTRRSIAQIYFIKTINNPYKYNTTLQQKCFMTLYYNQRVEDIKQLPPIIYSQYIQFVECLEYMPLDFMKQMRNGIIEALVDTWNKYELLYNESYHQN